MLAGPYLESCLPSSIVYLHLSQLFYETLLMLLVSGRHPCVTASFLGVKWKQ